YLRRHLTTHRFDAMRASRAIAGAVLALAAFAPAAHAQSNLVSTLAGTGTAGLSGDGGPANQAQLSVPIAVSTTPDGGYLITEQGNCRVRRVFPDGTIQTIAGSPPCPAGPDGDGGPATSAHLTAGVTYAVMAADGRVLISDGNGNNVRQVATDGTITTVAGSSSGSGGFSGENVPATSALLSFPAWVLPRPDGSFLISDKDNQRVRRVSSDGTINTVAGDGTLADGGDGGPSQNAQVREPTGLASTGDGGYLIAEIHIFGGGAGGQVIRRVAPDGTISTVAGTSGTAGFGGDGGPATSAQLNNPQGIAATPDGGFVFTDRANERIRRVAPDGVISTVAGTGTAGFNGDGQLGPATQLNEPYGLAINPEGDYLIADSSNQRVRLLDVAAPPPPPKTPLPATLTLDPTTATRKPGDPNTITATVRNDDGSAPAGAPIRYAIEGVNPGAGATQTDARGAAGIGWEGVHEGTDTVTAYVDTNGNQTFDLGEPRATATVTWKLPDPVQGKVFNLEPVSGIVKIRVIRKGKGVHGAQSNSFTTLDEARQVPLTTEVDVRRGRVRMTLAADKKGHEQQGEFYQGVYQTTQPRTGSNAVTELRLTEQLSCRSGKSGKVNASRARTRRLWGSGKGRFRTRGRHSAASVRGTIWLTKDSCTTTTTVVRQGVVEVLDFAKHTTVRVKAGHRYVARARRR
ncbi:MAG: hypothetical protein QOJ07_3044, partial [Thermoleophilaceae bacterium]|nr:hypothetical protein [Thermoleophilaceae bacterium]